MPLRNRKQNAAPHDKRHENGLAEPGRRVSKQRSDANLAGYVTDASSSAELIPTEPSVGTEEDILSGLERSEVEGEADGTSSTPSEMDAPSRLSREGGEDSLVEQVSDETGGNGMEHATISVATQEHVNGVVKKNDPVSAGPSFDPANVFIGPHALRDVIAVLMFLLQLPSSILAVIQLIFVILTLGNSSSNWSIASLTTPSEWFHSYGGNPSLMTILVADVVFGLLWSFLRIWLPSTSLFVLDWAQAVIAMSLFGGGSALKGGWSHLTICGVILGLPHLIKTINWKHYALDPLSTIISRTGLESTRLARITTFHSLHPSSHHWLRILVEIHIITQGLVRVVRRYTLSKGDIDTNHALNGIIPSNDPASESTRNLSTDGRPPGPPPANKDGKEKQHTGKRRRRQSNFIRNQQPFWASVATSTITITKDLEQAHIHRDTYETNTDETIMHDVKREGLEGRVWITKIEPTEIHFSAIWADAKLKDDEEATGSGQGEMHGLHIKLNNAVWRHFDCGESSDTRPVDGVHKIVGKIYGLTPGERFFIEFLGPNGKIVHSVHLLTRPVAASETAPTLPPPVQDALRPASPVTTLKKSIAASESQLNDARTKVKKTRRDRKTANLKLEREIENLDGRLSSSSANDDRQRQRQTQFRQNIKQAEDALAAIDDQIKQFKTTPETEQQAHQAKRRNWEEERDRRNNMHEEFDSARNENERQIQNARNDNVTLKQKRERLEARLANIDQKREALSASNLATRKERASWDAQRSAVLANYQAREQEYGMQLQQFDSQRQSYLSRYAQLQSEQQHFFYESGQSQMNGFHSPSNHTPETAYSALSPHSRHANYNGYASLGYAAGTPPIHSRQNSVRGKTRGRSSSMLSDVSGFTDAETGIDTTSVQMPEPTFPTVAGYSIPRNQSAGSSGVGVAIAPPPGLGMGAGSGSGSGSGTGSASGHRESPASPVLPIGTEIGRGSPRGFNRP